MSARWQTRQDLVHEIVLLNRQKVPQRAIARALRISRNTVRKVLRAHVEQREEGHLALTKPPPRLPRATKLDRFKSRVSELLREYPDITSQRVFEILSAEGFGGGYTSVKKYLRKVRPPPRPKPSLETPAWGPGKMAESDWTPCDVTYTTGLTQRLQIFSYVLVHSTRKFYQAYESYDVHALMAGHSETFSRFKGCAERCKYDGQATVARWEGNQPIYNPLFLAFCTHYEMQPWAIGHPWRPQPATASGAGVLGKGPRRAPTRRSAAMSSLIASASLCARRARGGPCGVVLAIPSRQRARRADHSSELSASARSATILSACRTVMPRRTTIAATSACRPLPRGNGPRASAVRGLSSPSRTSVCTVISSPSTSSRRRLTQLLCLPSR